MLICTKEQINKIIDYCNKCLPNKACGFLAGIIEGDKKIIKKIYMIRNIDESPQYYSMDEKEQLKAISDITKNNLKFIGNFHSNPETPSRPSKEDIILAIDPNLSYSILSLKRKRKPIFNSFIIKNRFVHKEELIVLE